MLVAYDTETMPIEELPEYPPKPIGLSIYVEGQEPRYICWGHMSDNNGTEDEAKQLLALYWNNSQVELVAHNDPFDSLVAHVHWGFSLTERTIAHDTMVMAFLCDPHALNYQLKPLAKKLLGMEPEEKDEVADWLKAKGYMKAAAKEIGALIWMAPGTLVGKYANGDTVRTMELFKYFKNKVEDTGMWKAYRREMALQPIMLENTIRGVCVDVDGLRRDVAMYDNALAKIDKLLFQMLDCEPFNINSDAQLADAIDKAHPGLAWTLTKTGKRSTSKANMERTLEGLTGKLLAVMQYRASIHTCVGTFMRPWLLQATHPKGNGRIRCQWNTTRGDSGGARTGRLSSTPSLMNIPTLASHKFAAVLELWEEWLKDEFPALPNVRSYVLPDEDEVLISYDFASQELRVLAHYEDGVLLEAYKKDPTQDLHQFAADTISTVLGLPFKRKHAKTCIAEGSLVLTDKGLVKIEDITGLHLVWDGVEYVKHTGLVFQGHKDVISYAGLTATVDHEVYTNEYGRLPLGTASAIGASIVESGKAEQAIRTVENNISGGLAQAWKKRWAHTNILASGVRKMRRSVLDYIRQYNRRVFNKVPVMQYNKITSLSFVRSALLGNYAKMLHSTLPIIQKLWSSWNPVYLQNLRRLRSIHRNNFPNEGLQQAPYRSNRQQWGLHTRKFTCSTLCSKRWEQIFKCICGIQRLASFAVAPMALTENRLPWYATGPDTYSQEACCKSTMAGDCTNTSSQRRQKVYDITNAGPRHRFTVSNYLVSNCSFAILYGSGLDTLAAQLGSSRDEASTFKEAYLTTLPGVRKLLDQLKQRGRTNEPLRTWGGRVYYVEPPKFIDGRWRSFDYKLLNYLVQGSSADITKEAIIAYHQRKVHGRFLLTVHDQIVVSVKRQYAQAEAKILQSCMESIPLDAPLLADGSYGPNLHDVRDFNAENESEFSFTA